MQVESIGVKKVSGGKKPEETLKRVKRKMA
jgi:hypothetical protein